MTTPIGSSTAVAHAVTKPVHQAPVKPAGRDADGDNDGTKAGQVDKSAPTPSGGVGNIVNVTA